jgi:hypothetical protein
MDSTAKQQKAMDTPPGRKIPDRIETCVATLEFTHDFANGYPTDATIERPYDDRDFQPACQAYLWPLPAVSFTAWHFFAAKLVS